MKILIVDDEALARSRLRDLIGEDHPGHELAEAANGLEALALIESGRPDLVLLDIRMPEMDGLEVARHMCRIDDAPALVFTTAYQDHALEAFEKNAVDYLVKPIRRERLGQAIHKASRLHQSQVEALRAAAPEENRRRHLSASSHGRILLKAVDEIAYLKAEQKYVTACWPGGELLLDESLKSLETEFADRFVRIHRNTLVAIECITGLEKDPEGNSLVLVRDMPVRLPVSRRHVAALKKLLK